ncbi:hypothetical protein L798_06454 [Zootermopsis nevadensis]|uniref:Uncharacterized protein n=1 Tax=Zootermopsis nevadensis TaxID=136037 RepID=A0A067R5Z1_ZOONE|nr:hypothetical protein L798_06454 [Zootermopsis nevadensis]
MISLPATNEKSFCHVVAAFGQEIRVGRDATSVAVITDGVARGLTGVGFKEPRATARADPTWRVVRMMRRISPSATRTALRVGLLRAPLGHAPTWRTLGASHLSMTVAQSGTTPHFLDRKDNGNITKQ